MHASSVSSPSRAGYALTPYATTAISKPNNATTKSINTTDTTSTVIATATGIKSTTLAAAAAAIATITVSMPTATTVNTTKTPAIASVDESSLKQIKKQPPAPTPAPVSAPVPAPVPTHSQPSTSFSAMSTPTPTTATTSATASSSQQQLSSSSSPSPIQLLAPPSQEYRLRRAKAGSPTTTIIRPASPIILTSPASPIIPIGPLSPTSPTSPTSSTMSGQSPLRRQVRLHAKPTIGGLTTATNNRVITGNLVSAAEQLQLKAQQLTGGGGSTATTSNNTRITGNLISAAEQLQLQAQQRLQKKPSLSPPHSPHPVSSTTAQATAETMTVDSLALSAPLPQTLRPVSPGTVTKESTPIVVESAPLPSLSSSVTVVPPKKTRPPTPDLAANKVSLASLPNSSLVTPSPSPLKSPTSPSSPSPLSMSFTSASSSPPSSPLHRTLLQARRQQQLLKKQQKLMAQGGMPLLIPPRQQSIPPPKISALLSPESSSESNDSESTTKATGLPQHHSPQEVMDRNEIDEWLPKFLTKGFDLSESWLGVQELSADPLPRQGSPTKVYVFFCYCTNKKFNLTWTSYKKNT
ncbi:MAG: hypothetical protein JOS17DRAFT_474015 [Linnemannia elongata]|nr:MAG: hypothetical protein JOS17DRAFT_474015 [Linnemannia elongata]